jgi:RimJ/RimL family protein N-acetyltransferase
VVTLRRVTPADLELLVAWRESAEEHDPYGYFGRLPTHGIRARYAEHGLLAPGGGTLVVTADDGAVLGEVSWHAVGYGPTPASDALDIGIQIVPEHRGRGHGTAAQRALAEYLFATYPVNRVQAGTDVTNAAEQRSLEKAGFTREGVIRGAQWRAGEWHDLVLYGRLRGDA